LAEPYIERVAPKGVTPVTRTRSVIAEAESRGKADDRTFFKVLLPSRGVFYQNRKADSVSVSPLNVSQVRSIYAASEAGDAWTRESTMVAAIQRSVPDFDLLTMTSDDYRFLLYWVRMNSYASSPYTVQWTHPRPDGSVARVNSHVSQSLLDVKECNPNRVPANPQFAYPTVSDKLDFLRLEDASEKYVALYAQYVKGKDLQEKIRILESMSADTLVQLKTHMRDFAHGVAEKVMLRDPEEGEQSEPYEVPLTFEISDFFP
jgi:hypothetical protein